MKKFNECIKCYWFHVAELQWGKPCSRCLDADMFREADFSTIKGQKFDKDKPDWTLLPWKEVEQVLEILEFGTKKYSKNNWQEVEPNRYEKAAMRHLISYVTGEKNDSETGKSHMAHLVCNALFLMWNDNKSLK